MLLNLLIFNVLSNAVTLLDNRTFYYSRNISIGIIYSILLCSINMINIDISIFNGLLHIDNLIQIFTIFILLSSLIILNLTNFYPYNNNNKINKLFNIFNIPEYSIIILFINIGAILLISSLDIVTIFLSLELQSYGLYILCTLHRNSESSTSAGLKYFLLGSLASCLILLGLAFIYANEGNTNLENLQIISTISYNSNYYNVMTILNSIEISLIILSVGFLFKIAAAPFHFWSPDVYDQIPTIITSFVAIIAKISILIILFFLIKFTFNSWTTSLLLSSLLSILIGSILGLTQSRIKRLYAYSAISHIGFILLALSIFSNESIIAFLFYLVQYTLSNINLFFITIIIGYSLYLCNNKSLSNESPLQFISQLKGYSYINPVLALSLSITLFSFAGIPPLSGFFAKQLVLKAALSEGYLFITLIAILTSVISAVYYLVIIKQMFFYKNNDNVEIKELNINSTILNIVSILTLLMLVFIFFINEVLNIFIIF